jgi:hypothetical protein
MRSKPRRRVCRSALFVSLAPCTLTVFALPHADLESAASGFAKNDPEVAKELALLKQRLKEEEDKQRKTFSGE